MAAGQGFKTFVTGEVLTAGDVNGYLMQGINVFTNATARDAAITAPAEGQFAFTKDNNSLWYYDGAAWVASGATGDIEGVTAGVGISGGGTSGTVTITNSMATAIDAKGDLVAGTGADAFSRLAVGANNTVLTADSTTATGLKWAAAASGPTGYTLLNSGGTALSGGVITVSFSAQKKLWIYFSGASCSTGGGDMKLRFNADSAANYQYVATNVLGNTSWSPNNVTYEDGSTGASSTRLLYFSTNQSSAAIGAISMDLADTTGWKVFDYIGGPDAGGTNGQWQFNGKALYKASAAITSISLIPGAGNFDAGQVYVYGAN